jgi:cell wall-associated NlpC family hydrolase
VLDSNPVRGSVVSTYPGDTSTPYPSGAVTGDLMFYDWGGDKVVDHVSIVVGTGTDPNGGDIGTLVDSHTINRYHAIWSLETYDADKLTTTIYVTHLNTNI